MAEKNKKRATSVLHVCSEVFPYLKTGGLADVSAALPQALLKIGYDIRILVPGFPAFMEGLQNKELVHEFSPRFGAHQLRLYFGRLEKVGLSAYVIDAPGLYDRPGNPYIDIFGSPYGDNHRRFALLGWMAARLVEGYDYFWKPAIVHGHDWHAGLTFAYLKVLNQFHGTAISKTVFTIHNIAYQGNFSGYVLGELELPVEFFNAEGMEFYGQLSFLKTGLMYANKITTVSPTYAKEIHWGEQSCGLDGVIQYRDRDVVGILNGIDVEAWNPSSDKNIAAPYSGSSLAAKRQCRHALQEEMGLLCQNTTPIFCVVSRFAFQKGLDVLLGAMHTLISRNGQIVIVGNGERYIEEGFLYFANQYPKQVAVHIGYDEVLVHRVIAGSDVIIVPSRYEPCGLTQLYGLRYGTIPLVHRVGGLADSVVDASEENQKNRTATGFTFNDLDVHAIDWSISRIFELFSQPEKWRMLQRQGMKQKLSWANSAREYKKIYDSLLK